MSSAMEKVEESESHRPKGNTAAMKLFRVVYEHVPARSAEKMDRVQKINLDEMKVFLQHKNKKLYLPEGAKEDNMESKIIRFLESKFLEHDRDWIYHALQGTIGECCSEKFPEVLVKNATVGFQVATNELMSQMKHMYDYMYETKHIDKKSESGVPDWALLLSGSENDISGMFTKRQKEVLELYVKHHAIAHFAAIVDQLHLPGDKASDPEMASAKGKAPWRVFDTAQLIKYDDYLNKHNPSGFPKKKGIYDFMTLIIRVFGWMLQQLDHEPAHMIFIMLGEVLEESIQYVQNELVKEKSFRQFLVHCQKDSVGFEENSGDDEKNRDELSQESGSKRKKGAGTNKGEITGMNGFWLNISDHACLFKHSQDNDSGSNDANNDDDDEDEEEAPPGKKHKHIPSDNSSPKEKEKAK